MSKTIKFTGFEIDQKDLQPTFTDRKVKLPVPDTWYRCECSLPDNEVPSNRSDLMTRISNWLAEHLTGRWGSYANLSSRKLVIFFEDQDDALLFKLHDGESSIFSTTKE